VKVSANPPPRPAAETLRTPPKANRSFERLVDGASRPSTDQGCTRPQPPGLRPGAHPQVGRAAEELARRGPANLPSAMRAERAWRAFGFGELGLFGEPADRIGGAADAVAQGVRGQPLALRPTPGESPIAQRAEVPARKLDASPLPQQTIRTELGEAPRAEDSPVDEAAAAPASAEPEPGSPADAGEPDAPPLPRRELRAIARILLARSGLQDRAQVQLTVTGNGDGLEVAVRARDLGEESHVRLRRALADACKAHGLPLARLVLNGVPERAPAPSFNGESHGDRAR